MFNLNKTLLLLKGVLGNSHNNILLPSDNLPPFLVNTREGQVLLLIILLLKFGHRKQICSLISFKLRSQKPLHVWKCVGKESTPALFLKMLTTNLYGYNRESKLELKILNYCF